jgi:hypothetical protein
MLNSFKEKIKDKSAQVGVVGLGYVVEKEIKEGKSFFAAIESNKIINIPPYIANSIKVGEEWGESLLFTDIHPFVVTCYKAVSSLVPSLKNDTVAFLNILLVWSFPLTAFILFFLFRNFGVSIVSAVFGAFSITVLSSQVLLWEYGHLALSYPLVVPLGWLLLEIFFKSRRKLLWSFIIAFNVFFWFTTHGYDGMSLVLFYSAIYLLLFLSKSKDFTIVELAKYFTLQVLLPVAVFYVLVKLNDIYPGDRIDFEFTAQYASHPFFVFVPLFGPFKPFFYFFYNFDIPQLTWGRIGNYVGIVTDFALLGLVFYFRKISRLENFKRIWLYLLASSLVLLYSFGIPFKYNLSFLLDVVPSFKQFSGIGRFAWVFYYVAGVYAFWLLDKAITKEWLRNLVVIVAAIVFSVEAVGYHYYESKRVMNKNILDFSNVPLPYKKFVKINADKYAAAIILPYYVKYTNPYVSAADDKTEFLGYITNRYLHLPLANAILSRPAITPGKMWRQLFSPDWCEKPVLSMLNKNKPLLIVYSHSYKIDSLQKKFLTNKCGLMYSGNNYDLYEYYPVDTLLDSDTVFSKFYSEKDSLKKHGDWFVPPNTFFYEYKVMKLPENFYFVSNYGFSKDIDSNENILILPAKNMIEGKKYELSFWYYNKGYDEAFVQMVLYEYSPTLGETVWQKYVTPTQTGIICGDWNLVTFTFEPKSKSDFFILSNTYYEFYGGNKMYLNNIIVIEKDKNVYRQMGSDTLVVNNRIYIRKKH